MLYLLVFVVLSHNDIYVTDFYVVGFSVGVGAVDANSPKPPYPINW